MLGTDRLDAPGVAQHVIQDVDDCRSGRHAGIDRVRYLRDLREIAQREGCLVHAYALLASRIHLLLTPRTAGGVVRTLRGLDCRRASRGDDRACAVPLPEPGRGYRAHPVYTARQLLRCQRDIELQPVRAGIVADPISYRWSSHRHHVLGLAEHWLAPHRALLALGRNARERRERYRRMVMEAACAQCSQKRDAGDYTGQRNKSAGASTLGVEHPVIAGPTSPSSQTRPDRDDGHDSCI